MILFIALITVGIAFRYAWPSVYATPLRVEIEEWTATTALPQALAHRNTVVHRDHLLVIGGKTENDAPTAAIYAARINPDGSLGTWRTAGQLPVALYLHAAVVADDALFVIGGWDGTNTRAEVWRATIAANGDVGNWTSTTRYPIGLDLHDAVLLNGHIYVVGGWDGAAPLQGVYAAAVTSTGLGAWQQVGTLPTPLYRSAVTGTNGRLYVTGGFDNNQNGVAAVWVATVNGTNSLGAWRATTPLPNAHFYHKALIHDGRVVVLGGQNATTAFNQVYSASIAADGMLGAWRTEVPLPVSLYRFGAVTVTRNGSDAIYVTGGLRNESAYESKVYHSTVILPPTATPTPTPTATPTPTRQATSTPALHLNLRNQPAAWLAPGDETTYTILYKNDGNSTLSDVEITNVIPDGAELVDGSIRSNTGDFSISGSEPGSAIVWALGDIEAQDEGEVAYRVRRQVTPTPVVPLALTIDLTAPPNAAANEEIVYTIEVTNRSPIVLNNLVITNAVPLGATYLRGADRRPVDGVVQWTLPALAADSSATVQYTVLAAESLVNYDYRVVSQEDVSARGRTMAVTRINGRPPRFGDGFVIINGGAVATWGEQRQGQWVESNAVYNPAHTLYLPFVQR